jgi:hypothetical protein
MGVPPFLIALALFMAVRPGAARLHEAPAESRASRVALVPLIWGYLAAGCYLIAFWAEESWIPALLIRRHGFDAAAAGRTFGIITIISGVVSPIVGLRLTDRLRLMHGKRGSFMAAAALLLIAVPAALPLSSPNSHVVIAASLILDTAILSCAFAFISSLQDLLPTRHLALGIAIVYFTSGAVGASAGPTLVALATDRLYGAESALDKSLVTVLLPTLSLSILAFLAGVRSHRRAPTAP